MVNEGLKNEQSVGLSKKKKIDQKVCVFILDEEGHPDTHLRIRGELVSVTYSRGT